MTDSQADQRDLPGHIEDSVSALAQLHADHHRGAPPLQRVVDRSVRLVGRPGFVGVLTAFVVLWIGANIALGRFYDGFDPPPYPILQGIAQFGALFITVLILITQRHESELSDHRDQLTLEMVMLIEQKNAKIVELMEEMRRDNPLIKDRIDAHAEALSVPSDRRQVRDAIKEKQSEMLASIQAEIGGRTVAPDMLDDVEPAP